MSCNGLWRPARRLAARSEDELATTSRVAARDAVGGWPVTGRRSHWARLLSLTAVEPTSAPQISRFVITPPETAPFDWTRRTQCDHLA